ncbi:RHS repeat domain-containing protein [Pseudomonas sp. R47(2017)]|uniref:RHS repeat domain-containing protein n=1 Tax=unclassified Pseudomonas TaxID=196821 RepID=UPI003530EE80
MSVRQVDYLRTVAGEAAEALVTRQVFDKAGRLAEQRDPRISSPNFTGDHDLNGESLKVASVDAGWRLTLPGLAGEILQRWDERGHHWRMTYDPQLRLTTARESAQPDPETFTYADASSDAGFNLRGQLLEQVDPSGSLVFDSFALTGEALGETRTFHDGKAFSSHRTYSPLSAVLEQTDAGGHRQQSRYDLAGQLTQAQLQLKGQTTWQAVLRDAQYDAAGQIIEQQAGNGVTQHWAYDPASLRLQRQSARLDQQPPLQDFEYEYDPVGNITRILDNLFTPRHFANQRVDGHREFSYDSLYRLHTASGYDDAAPSDTPGLPQPTHPADRRNYTQTYTYDHGGNLTELRHVRDGASYTRRLRIDPASNRGVRWNEGDPEPDFASLFDRHGNLLAVQPGQPLQWNSRDELSRATLVQRDSGPDDAEQYRYSDSTRVYKRLDTDANRHFQEVRYLPGLEIRSKDNGEELHIVVLPTGVRCLHWAAVPPSGIKQNQLRYTLEDHLGSCLMELDQQAGMISHEGYYPFGATAWMAARSQIEVDYKFVRYSGKEMDVSGLYYYGARYYAPWLQRWVSADPAGDVDGLNLYGFVGNNPMVRVDADGRTWLSFPEIETAEERDLRKATSARNRASRIARGELSRGIVRHAQILEISLRRALNAQQQILNHRSPSEHALSSARRTAVHLVGQGLAFGAGIAVGVGGQALGGVAPVVGNATAVVLGFVVKKTVGLAVDYVAEHSGASASVKLKGGKLAPEKIIRKAEYKTLDFKEYIQQRYAHMNLSKQKNALRTGKEVVNTGTGMILKVVVPDAAGAASTAVSAALGTFEIVHEIAGAGSNLSEEKIAKAYNNISKLIDALNENMTQVKSQFEAAGVNAMHTFSFFGNNPGDTVESLQTETNRVINELRFTQTMLHSRSSRFSKV